MRWGWKRLLLLLLLLLVAFIGLRIGFFFLSLYVYDWSPYLLRRDDVLSLNTNTPTEFRIPRIVHQTFKANVTPPINWQHAQQSCKSVLWDYQFRMWTDEDARAFIREHYPRHLANYDSYPHHIERVDALRYFILYHYGGVYLDMDVGCQQRLDPLLQSFDVVLVKTQPMGLSNDVMMSAARHPFFLQMMQQLPRWNWRYGLKFLTVMASTGPLYLDAQVMSYLDTQRDLSVFKVLDGELYGNSPNSFFYHTTGSSWHSAEVSWIDYLYRKGVWSFIVGLLFTSVVVWIALWCKKKIALRARRRRLLP